MSRVQSTTLSIVRVALKEDLGRDGDITSQAVVPSGKQAKAEIRAKASGVVAGLPFAVSAFRAVDAKLRVVAKARDGQRVRPGAVLLAVSGSARSILAAERTALNLLGHLSGIATLTAHYVQQVRGTRARIFDTRKTLPALRLLQKYSVRMGRGYNHRWGLDDAVLIKTNHLRLAGGAANRVKAIRETVAQARRRGRGRWIEIEVTTLSEFRAALDAKPDMILLDNWPLRRLRKAVALRTSRQPLLEVSGGVTLANVRAIAKTGVDRISIGRLTHSAPSLDLALRIV